jgi:hypothetical protein
MSKDSKFKVGDRVRIVNKLNKEMYDYVPQLGKEKGKEDVVSNVIEFKSIQRFGYILENSSWTWYDEYLEEI